MINVIEIFKLASQLETEVNEEFFDSDIVTISSDEIKSIFGSKSGAILSEVNKYNKYDEELPKDLYSLENVLISTWGVFDNNEYLLSRFGFNLHPNDELEFLNELIRIGEENGFVDEFESPLVLKRNNLEHGIKNNDFDYALDSESKKFYGEILPKDMLARLDD